MKNTAGPGQRHRGLARERRHLRPAAVPLVWLVALLTAVPAIGRAQENTHAIASYRIDVQLDPETTLLQATETLTWVNDAAVAVPDLWFHLYQNAFMNESSTKMRERGRFPGGSEPLAERIGYTDVEAIRLGDGTDLMGTLRWRHPDDDNVDDRTVFSVDLPQPVPPGAEVSVLIDFTTKLPHDMERSGVWGDYYIVTQWFPKIAVFEEVGEGGANVTGWNAHQFHSNGEFYADFGHYEVHITVPERYVVGGTGQRVQTLRQQDDRVTYVYEQSDVHDFAWTADPDFEEVVRTFDPATEVSGAEKAEVAALLGVAPESLRLRPVEVTLLIPPAFAHHTERHLRATMNALKWFGLWYGAYPYDTLTVLVPADGFTGGGMEYPTFFTSTDVYPLRYGPLRSILLPEQVTVHEFGHQFWYGLVANNETEEAWLDEGFNSYSTAKTLSRAYGVAGGSFLGLQLTDDATARLQYIGSARTGSMVQNAWTYSRGGYQANSYPRPELVLRTLERTLGEATFARAMRAYHQRWRFRHPTSQDFFAVVEEVCDCDLSSFWQQMVLGDKVADYAIAEAVSRPVEPPRGRFRRHGEWVMVKGKPDAQEPDAKGQEGENAATQYYSRVVVQRLEDFVWPVEVRLHFEDDSEVTEQWDGRQRLHRIEHTRPSALAWAVVDPDNKLPLDIDRLNNSRVLHPDPAPRRRWALQWLFWMANVLFAASGLM
ncbi:MAG: M1 family metallopeptidase [Acidobacteriota bacterium]